MTRWRTDRIVCGGVALARYQAGSTASDAPAIVMVHGLGHWTSAAWDRLVPQLDPSWRIVGFDLPGFGESERPPARYDLRFFAEVLSTALARDLPDRFALCGHSLGGMVAAELAARFPQRVARLTLIAPGGFAAPLRQIALVLASPALAPLTALPPARPLVAAVWRDAVADPAALDEAFVEQAYRYACDPAWRRAFNGVYTGALPLLLGLRAQRRRFARYPGPVLVVWGARDRFLPVAGAAAALRVYPRAELAILPDSGHLPMVEEPERTGAALRAFLAR